MRRIVLITLICSVVLGTFTASATAQSYRESLFDEYAVNLKVPKSCKSKWCNRVRATIRISKRIDRALAGYGSPMAGSGLEITRAARRENSNPFILLGIAGAESSFGKAACGFNSTGLGACWRPDVWTSITLCGRTYHGPTYVNSWARGIRLTGRLIRCLLPEADDIWEVRGYCAGCSTWNSEVAAIAKQYFNSGPGLKWKDALAVVNHD